MAEPSHVPDAPLSFNAAWQSAQNVLTNFPCLLRTEVPTLILTENTLEDLGDRERRQACTNVFLVPYFSPNFRLAILVAYVQAFSRDQRKRVNINKKIIILSKMSMKMIKW